MLSWLTPLDLHTELINRASNEKCFSMLRFGDGEYCVCKYVVGCKDIPEQDFREKFERWFGKEKVDSLSLAELKGLGQAIFNAYMGCDLLGIPCFKEAYSYPKWKGVDEFVNKFFSGKKTFYFYDIFTLWKKHKTFQKILEKSKEVVLITSRNIADKVRERFKTPSVWSMFIPPEHFMWKPNAVIQNEISTKKEPHYPTRYLQILKTINASSFTNKLCLVGAGGLGKIYCNEISLRGGIALDIGAMFDGWAGFPTRPYLLPIEDYQL